MRILLLSNTANFFSSPERHPLHLYDRVVLPPSVAVLVIGDYPRKVLATRMRKSAYKLTCTAPVSVH